MYFSNMMVLYKRLEQSNTKKREYLDDVMFYNVPKEDNAEYLGRYPRG